VTFEQLGELDKARSCFAKATSLDPSSQEAFCNAQLLTLRTNPEQVMSPRPLY